MNYSQSWKNFTGKMKSILTNFPPLLINEFDESSLDLQDYCPALKTDQKGKIEIFKDCLRTLERKNKKNEVSQMVAAIKIKGEEDFQQLEKVFQLTKQRLMR